MIIKNKFTDKIILEIDNLCGADLREVDLRGANLCRADLREVDLRGANLCEADLRGADLSKADLGGVDLGGVVGNMIEIKSMRIEKYAIAWTKDILQIGCENHKIEEWKNYIDREIIAMDGNDGLVWWKKWKDFIFQAIELSK